jgi:nucleotidyltransferase/DNA polymerase involved in DNA repair
MRKILSIFLPRFYVVATGKKTDGMPLIVERDGTVLDGSEEVFANGGKAGMPVRRVLRLAPARVVAEDVSLAKPLFRRVWEIVYGQTPLVETTDYHEGFADLTGCLRDGESLAERAKTLREQLREATGLHPRIGGGSTTLSARIAAGISRDGFIPRFRSEERALLWDSPIGACAGFSERLVARLALLGVETFGDLYGLSPEQVISVAGKRDGWTLIRLARLEEARPLRPNYPPESVVVSKSFLPGIEDEPLAFAWLARLCKGANDALAKKDRRPMEMSLTLHLEGGERRIRGMRFSREGVGATARAFRAERLLRELWKGEEIERLELSFGALEPVAAEQTLLWDESRRKQRESASYAVEMSRARFGPRGLSFGNDDPASVSGAWVESVLLNRDLVPLGSGWH